MAKDTLTFKLNIEADFKTIQAIRQFLGVAPSRAELGQLLAKQTETILLAQDLGPFKLTPVVKVSRYSETKTGSRFPPPIVKDNILTVWDYELDREIESLTVDSPDWLEWLQEEYSTSFRYETQTLSFTVIREHRQGRRVWYAHRRLKGKLHRVYLGKSENVTAQKLAQAAQKLAQVDLIQSH
jgi:hypothetical protein